MKHRCVVAHLFFGGNMEKLKVGKILGTHALKGEVKIRSFSDFDQERFQVGNVLWIETNNEQKEVMIQTVRKHKGNFLISFKDMQDINLIEPYCNCFVYAKKDRDLLKDGEYYYDDLIDCTVKDETGKQLGKVIQVSNNTRHDILHIDGLYHGMIPYVDAFIIKEEIEKKEITVRVIEGMLYEN